MYLQQRKSRLLSRSFLLQVSPESERDKFDRLRAALLKVSVPSSCVSLGKVAIDMLFIVKVASIVHVPSEFFVRPHQNWSYMYSNM